MDVCVTDAEMKGENADKEDQSLVVSTPMKHRVTADVHLWLTNIRPNIRLFSDIVEILKGANWFQ